MHPAPVLSVLQKHRVRSGDGGSGGTVKPCGHPELGCPGERGIALGLTLAHPADVNTEF